VKRSDVRRLTETIHVKRVTARVLPVACVVALARAATRTHSRAISREQLNPGSAPTDAQDHDEHDQCYTAAATTIEKLLPGASVREVLVRLRVGVGESLFCFRYAGAHFG
jgi:hypothetical protein